MYQSIRQNIIEVLNSSQVKRIKFASRTETSDKNEYPIAVVFPTESQSEFAETGKDTTRETYLFTIRILYPFTEGQEKADIELEKAVDEVIDVFRDRTVLPSVDWVQPVPGRWGYMDRQNGTHRVAELTIRAVKYVNV